MEDTVSKKVSRRDFARTSVAAGAAAVAMPGVLVGKTPAVTRGAAAAGRQAALGRRSIAYGGDAEFRDNISLAYGSQGGHRSAGHRRSSAPGGRG